MEVQLSGAVDTMMTLVQQTGVLYQPQMQGQVGYVLHSNNKPHRMETGSPVLVVGWLAAGICDILWSVQLLGLLNS